MAVPIPLFVANNPTEGALDLAKRLRPGHAHRMLVLLHVVTLPPFLEIPCVIHCRTTALRRRGQRWEYRFQLPLVSRLPGPMQTLPEPMQPWKAAPQRTK